MLLQLLYVGMGGFVGAILRYVVSGLLLKLVKGAFPLGTMTVNVLGCLVLGFLMTIVEDERSGFPPNARFFVAVGLLGSFTTFSTFSYETMQMAHLGSFGAALANGMGSLAAGFVAAYIGMVLGRLI